MSNFIDKSAIVAELEKRIKECNKLAEAASDNNLSNSLQANELLIRQYTSLLNFLDTIETKDVDEIIKNAEDHAYFAGSENTREKLIDKACKWWEEELTYPSMTPEEFKLYKSKVRRFRKDIEDET